MIEIKTESSRVYLADGTLATGQLFITPNKNFEFVDSLDSNKKKKVARTIIQVNFSDGFFTSFGLAPTLNSNQNETDIYYEAKYVIGSDVFYEYWVIDGAGPVSIEIVNVTQVTVGDPRLLTGFVQSDDVSVTPGANKIPRADGSGTLNAGWFTATGYTAVVSYPPGQVRPSPTAGVMAEWPNTLDNVLEVWIGDRWIVLYSPIV